MMHMKHMKFEKGFFERTAGANAFQRMGYDLPPRGRGTARGGGRSYQAVEGVNPIFRTQGL